MKKIVDILVERDGLTFEEAKEVVKNVIAEIKDILAGGGDYLDVEELISDELGLEMDYFESLLVSLVLGV